MAKNKTKLMKVESIRHKDKRTNIPTEELRDFVHVIDITQLYYTPDLYNSNPANSTTSLNLDYTYLLFCTEMLALISNLAPLYTRGAAGDSILRAVFDVEMLAILGHHLIGAAHDAGGSVEFAARRILERLAGLQHRLRADNARAADLLRVPRRVGDDPVPAEQLHRVVTFVGDSHGVNEDPFVLERPRSIGCESRLDLDANVVCDGFRRRRVKGLGFEFRHGPSTGSSHDIN